MGIIANYQQSTDRELEELAKLKDNSDELFEEIDKFYLNRI